MAFDAVLFDLDGTLWDSSRTVRKSWVEAAENFRPHLGNAITLEAVHRNMGKMLPIIFADIFPDLPEAERHELMCRCGKHEMEVVAREGGILMPELAKTLEALGKDKKLFIVSNCQNGYIPAFFRAHGLKHLFTGYEYAGRTGKSKGENIALVVEQYGLKQPVYLGDTQGDCDASDFAGVPFIHAAYGFGKIDHSVPTVERFSDLPRILDELGSR